jgi:hypothetical protein
LKTRKRYQTQLNSQRLDTLRSGSPFYPFLDLYRYFAHYLRDIDALFLLDFNLDFPSSVKSPAARITPHDLFSHAIADSINLFLQFERKYYCVGIPLVRCFPTYFDNDVIKLRASVDSLSTAFLRLKLCGTLPLSLAI